MTSHPGSILLRLRGILRSLFMYYGGRGARRRMDGFYGRLLRKDDLCFDIGAHAGNRTLCFLRLGARVVALEPQPDFQGLLRLLLRFRPADERARVTLLAEAVGREAGMLELHISQATPTVTSGSRDFIEDTGAIASFDIVDWDRPASEPFGVFGSFAAATSRALGLPAGFERVMRAGQMQGAFLDGLVSIWQVSPRATSVDQ